MGHLIAQSQTSLIIDVIVSGVFQRAERFIVFRVSAENGTSGNPVSRRPSLSMPTEKWLIFVGSVTSGQGKRFDFFQPHFPFCVFLPTKLHKTFLA